MILSSLLKNNLIEIIIKKSSNLVIDITTGVLNKKSPLC